MLDSPQRNLVIVIDVIQSLGDFISDENVSTAFADAVGVVSRRGGDAPFFAEDVGVVEALFVELLEFLFGVPVGGFELPVEGVFAADGGVVVEVHGFCEVFVSGERWGGAFAEKDHFYNLRMCIYWFVTLDNDITR